MQIIEEFMYIIKKVNNKIIIYHCIHPIDQYPNHYLNSPFACKHQWSINTQVTILDSSMLSFHMGEKREKKK